MGRPTKYDKKFIAQIDKYLKQNKDDYVDGKLKVKLPTIEGFALFIGVNKTTLYEWEENEPTFSNALDKIREEQRARLLNSGLSGEYNSTIAKLVLSSNHGMSDKQEIDHTSGGKVIKGVNVILDKAYGDSNDTDEEE